ncbi:MAG: hypothetical protein MPN21_26685 [Thermoanaerobaculia bacterium]|nr:hypothetical protein [Thermoanaerobaculia bacterium]
MRLVTHPGSLLWLRSMPWLLFAVTFLFANPVFAGTVEGSMCGNGVVEGAEQCDDGDLYPLDGCDPSCRYEQVQRFTSLALEGTTAPDFCASTGNQLGGAFSAAGLDVLNASLQAGINTGELSVLLQLLDLDDSTGTNDAALELGLLGGDPDPTDPSPGGLDAWFLVDDALLETDDRPSEVLTPSAIASLELTAGPNDVSLPFVGGELRFRNARLAARVDASTSPPSPPPLDIAPGLAAFESLEGADGSHGLCGNVTVGTLALIPAPDEVTSGGTACEACASSRVYVSCGEGPVTDACHSLLDVLVGGCQVLGCLATVIEPTQPDVGVGASPPGTLIFGPANGIDKVTVTEPDDAYSSWFQFTAERVHLTNNLDLIFRDGFESGDLTVWSNSTAP